MKFKYKGFTLLELVIIIGIISLVSSLGILAFNYWIKKFNIQNDTKLIFSILNEARTMAFTNKKTCGILWKEDKFKSIELRCDTNNDDKIDDNNGYQVIKKITLKTYFYSNLSCKYVRFEKEGFAKDSGSIMSSIKDIKPRYNCVKLFKTRIKLGHLEGNECKLE